MSEQAAREGKLTYAGAHSVTRMLDCFYKFYTSRSEAWVPNRNLAHTKRQRESLLSNWCMLSCRLGRLHVWEQPPAEHHPDHAPLPHPLQRPSGQAHRSISFGTTAHVGRSLQKQKRQQQMWNNNNIKKKECVWIGCEPLSCGCQQQQAVELLPTALTIQPVAGTVWFSSL